MHHPLFDALMSSCLGIALSLPFSGCSTPPGVGCTSNAECSEGDVCIQATADADQFCQQPLGATNDAGTAAAADAGLATNPVVDAGPTDAGAPDVAVTDAGTVPGSGNSDAGASDAG